MGRLFLNHLQYSVQQTNNCAEGLIFAIVESPLSIEMAEKLISTVDKVDDQNVILLN
jgi:hypothetical protein